MAGLPETLTVLVLIVALASGRVPIAGAFLAFVLFVALVGFMPFRDVLAMLADPTLVAVVCLVLFSSVVTRLGWLAGLLFDRGSHGLRATLLRFLGISGLVSAVMPNTAVVGAFMGPGSRHPTVSPHQLLLPLSYIALAGGVVTQFGTSANLIVVGQAQKHGIDLGFSDFFLPGLAAFACVLIVLVLVAPLVLREPGDEARTAVELYHIEARLLPGAVLVGKSVIDSAMLALDHFSLAEIIRDGAVIGPVPPSETLRENDVLIFVGDVRHLDELTAFSGLDIVTAPLPRGQLNIYHAVIAASSSLVGTTLKGFAFRDQFGASVFAIRRGGVQLSGKLGQIQLAAGDLMVIAASAEFETRADIRAHLHIVETDAPSRPMLSTRDAAAVSVVFGLFVVVALFELIDFAFATVMLVASALAMRWLSLREMRRIFPFDLAVSLWGSLVLGALIVRSPLDEWLAHALVQYAGGNTAFVAMLLIFVFTWLLTELLSNVSAAVTALPVAVEVARGLGLDPGVMALTVAFGASASFMVPFGYQTHLMVFAAGRYHFRDFAVLGAIVFLAYAGAALGVLYLTRL
ncbi:MAG: SLC13 family permease [Hyphomicrobiaceae bacterium]|nr:SLC13 family permease [Hyphomicrobiaceae bacterium]